MRRRTINPMPKPTIPMTIKRLHLLNRACHKLYVFHLGRENGERCKLNELYERQIALIEERHRILMERRYSN